MGLLDFANSILPPEEEKKKEKSGLLGFAEKVAPQKVEKPAAPADVPKKPGKRADIVAFAEKLVPTTPQGMLEQIAPAPFPEGPDVQYEKPPFMLTTPEGRQYPAPPVTGFTRVGGMLAKQIPGFKPLTEALSGKPDVWSEIAPKGIAEKILGSGLDFAGFLAAPARVGGAVARPIAGAVGKALGSGLAGAAAKYAAQHGISLGTASVLSELAQGASIKDAVKSFGPGAVMGEIFGLAGMAHLPKHPIVSQLIRQVGGRVLLGNKLSPESFTKENIGETIFNELLNTYFLAHGETPAKVFSGALAYKSATAMAKELGATPEEVRAAGGPIGWARKTFTELTEAARPVKELAAKEPEVLYSQEAPKKEEQLVIPGAEPPIVRPEPFRPEEMRAEQRVLPMPDASPLFKGTEPIETRPGAKPPDTLYSREVPGGEIEYLPAGGAAAHVGEAGWSQEALSRSKTIKFSIFDTRTGKTRDLAGPEAVDLQPRPGEVKYQTNLRTGKMEIVDAGPGEFGDLLRARAKLRTQLEAAGKPSRDILFSTEDPFIQAAREEDIGLGQVGKLRRGKDRAEKTRIVKGAGAGKPKLTKTQSKISDRAVKESLEDKIIEEARQAILEGATTYDSLDPAYHKLFDKRLTAGEREALRQGIDYHGLPVADQMAMERRLEGLSEGRGPMPKPLKMAPERPVEAQTEPVPPTIQAPTAINVPTAEKLGRAPRTLDELKAEIVRINEGRVSREQADALGALVNGVARYKGIAPDEYVASRFAELRTGSLEKPVYTQADKSAIIADCQKRGITDPQLIEKVVNGEPIASAEFLSDGRAVIRAFRKSNIAGMAHELGHVFRRDLSPAENAIIERTLGVKDGAWDRRAEERWAKQFELYLKRGTAPNEELKGIFAKFKKWIGSIYQTAKESFGPDFRVHPNVTLVLDKMLGGKEIPPDKVLGRATEPVGQGRQVRPRQPSPEGAVRPAPAGVPEELPHGPVIDGSAPSPADPVVKTLGPAGASITASFVKGLKEVPKIAAKLSDIYRNPIYFFERVPFLKKHVYDKKVDADANIAKAVRDLHVDIKKWQFNLKSLSDKTGKRLWIYSIAQQADGMKVLEKEGIKDIPELTPGEMEVYAEVRKNLERMYERINEARALLGLDPIGKIENYFTFLRKVPEMESLGFDPILDLDAKALTEALNKPSEPGFFKHRGKGAGPMEQNFYKVYESYMRKATNYIENAPIVAAIDLFTNKIEFKDANGEPQSYSMFKENNHVFTTLRQWGNFATGHKPIGWIADVLKEHPRAIKFVQAVNRNLATGVLSANLRSALIQPTSLRNSYIELGRKWMLKGAQEMISRGGRAEIMRLSKTLWGREFDIHAAAVAEGPSGVRGRISDAKWKLAEWGITPLKMLDLAAAQMTWAGAYAKATAPAVRGGKGLTGADAVRYADDIVTKTQASAAPRDIAPIQRALEGKLATMFQTFVINEWNYLSRHVLGIDNPALKGKEQAERVFRLLVATAVINVIYEDLFKLRSPFPTPERPLLKVLRGEMSPMAGGTEALWETFEQLPFVGGGLRWLTDRKTMYPAAIQAYGDILRLGGKFKRAGTEGRLDVFQPEDLSAPLRLLGIPGVSQAEKTMRRAEMGAGWFHALTGQKIESLGAGDRAGGTVPLDADTEALLKKYGLSPEEPTKRKKKEKKVGTPEADEILKKYGLLK